MPKIARAMWKKIVGSKKPDFFQEAELPLLEKYCIAEEIYQRALKKVLPDDGSEHFTQKTPQGVEIPDANLKVMEAQRRDQSALATKLRIAVNSRVSNHTGINDKDVPKSKRANLMFDDKK